MTIDVRPACSHSRADGTNGSRATTPEAADIATRGTGTGLAPSASATSDIDTSPSPARLYAPGGAEVVAANAIAAATSSWWTSCNGVPGSGNGGLSTGRTCDTFRITPGSWFHGMASTRVRAFGPATIDGRRTYTSSVEPP